MKIIKFFVLVFILLFSVNGHTDSFLEVHLDPRYEGEDSGTSSALPDIFVEYLNAIEREKYKLHFKNGLIYDANGELFDTYGYDNEFNYAIFVMDLNGNIYASNKYNESTEEGIDGLRFHHSSFLAGATLAGAGKIRVRLGKLLKINNDSGHYEPNGEHHQQTYNELKKKVGHVFDETRVDPDELKYIICEEALGF